MGSSCLICCFIGVVVHLWQSPGFSAASRINIALNGTVTQSSTFVNGEAEHAIDGNSDPQYSSLSCASTLPEPNPWWRLELPAVYSVSEIEVTNRIRYPQRLNGVEIRIGNSLDNNGNNNPSCATIQDDPRCWTQAIQCWGMEGRFINFNKPIHDLMTLCEIKVYGESAPSSISIQEIGRNITLVEKRLSWSDALLYCRDFHWDLLTLRGPEDQEMIYDLVARALFPLTSHLWVGLHRSISEGSWFWMSGDPMDFTQFEHGSNVSSLCGAVSNMDPSTWRQRSCEEHLNFMCFTGPTKGVDKVHFYSSTREKQIRCS